MFEVTRTMSLHCVLLDGREEWLARSKIVAVLEKDPVFDKSQR